MGNKESAIQLVPGPGFKKIKANQVPGYEKYDFGAYEIWGPYKKTIVGSPGSMVWKDSPIGHLVDNAYVYDMCSLSETKIRYGIGLKSASIFNTKPDMGTDKPACLADNITVGNKEDGLFYIHYKHPVFARIFRNAYVTSQFSGLLPTLLTAKQIEKGKMPIIKRSIPTSAQNIAEIGFLAYKAMDLKTPDYSLPKAVREPLDQAVNLINRSASMFNSSPRVLRGGYRKTRKSKKLKRNK